MRVVHPPKLEFFEDHLFILYRGLSNVGQQLEFMHQQIAFFVGETFLVTMHARHSYGISKAMEDAAFLHHVRSPLRTALAIMRFSSEHYLRSVLDFEVMLDELEDQMFDEESSEESSEAAMSQLTRFRSQLIKLRRSFNYHLRIADGLRDFDVDEDPPPITALHEDTHSINDMHDRFERLHSLVSMHYEICSDLLDAYLNLPSHKLNNSMRILTVVTVIFVPLGFLTGLYGVNFETIPGTSHRYGFFVLLGVMLAMVTGMLVWFRRKHWL